MTLSTSTPRTQSRSSLGERKNPRHEEPSRRVHIRSRELRTHPGDDEEGERVIEVVADSHFEDGEHIGGKLLLERVRGKRPERHREEGGQRPEDEEGFHPPFLPVSAVAIEWTPPRLQIG